MSSFSRLPFRVTVGFLFAVTFLCITNRAASVENTPASLEIGSSHEAQIGIGDEHRFTVERTEQAIFFELEQRNIDLELSVRDASGELLVLVDAPSGPIGTEVAYLDATDLGSVTVGIRPANEEITTGAYQLRVTLPPGDGSFKAAAQAMTAAATVDENGNPTESLTLSARGFANCAELWVQAGDARRANICQYLQATQEIALAEFAAAEQRLETVVGLASVDTATLYASLSALGETRLRQSKLADAQVAFSSALSSATSAGDSFLRARALNYLGLVAQYRNQPRSAIGWYDESLALLPDARFQHDRAVTLGNLGGAHYQLGQFPEAIDYYQQALAIHDRSQDADAQATVLGNLATLYRDQGDLAESLELNLRTLKIYDQMGNAWGRGLVRQRLGILYTRLGDFIRAERLLQEAYEIRNAQGSIGAAAGSALALAQVHVEQRDYAKAAEANRLALSLYRQTGVETNVARTRLALADVLQHLGKPDEATVQLREARPPIVQEALTRQVARLDHLDGRSLAATGHIARAVSAFESALRQRRATGDRLGEAEVLLDLARYSEDPTAVLRHLDAAEGAVNATRQDLHNPALRASFTATLRRLHDARVAVHIQRYQTNGDRADANAGYLASARFRGRTLIELQRSQVEQSKGAQSDRRKALQRELNTLWFAQRGITGSGTDAENSRALQTNISRIDDVLAELDQLDNTVLGSAPLSALENPPDLTRISETLPAGSLLLHYHIGSEHGVVFAIDQAGFKVHSLPDAGKLRDSVEPVLDALRATRFHAAERASLQKLSELLLPEVVAANYTQLFVVADDVLHLLPFNSLLGSDGRYLVESVTVTNLPAASALIDDRLDGAPFGADTPVVVIADPVFDPSDARARATAEPPETPAGSEFLRSSLSTSNVRRLPFSSLEADIISDRGESVDVFSGFSANREQLLFDPPRAARILHFATHGFVNESMPRLSGLLLSQLDEDGERIDGFLSAADIATWAVDPSLVVLSACDTALGRHVASEGLRSLTRAFMEAGARQVVSTLWAVADKETAQLMESFYDQLFEGYSASDALAGAQRVMLNRPETSAPYFWAGFTIQALDKPH